MTKLYTSLIALVILFNTVPLQAQLDQTAFTIDDYFSLKSVGSPVISPEGDWIAFTVSEKNYEEDSSETRIWMVSAEGGEPVPMTAKGYSAGNPKWSPDGKYLSFTASRNEEKTQVWTLNRLGGEAQQLTDIKQDVSGYEWSPDGSRLVLLIKDEKPENDRPEPYVIDRLQFKRDYAGYLDNRRTHLYTFTPGDTTATRITFGDYDVANPAWSPDEESIAFVSNRTGNPDGNTNSDIWVVNADNPDQGLVQVTHNPGSDHSPAWSPDGKSIAHVSVVDTSVVWYATNHLLVTPADGSGQSRVLTEQVDRNVSSPRFSEDGEEIWFILEDSSERQLASIPATGGALNREITGGISLRAFDIHGSMLATRLGQFNEPHEIYTYRDQSLEKITSFNQPLLSERKRPDVEEIRFNSADGTPVEGFLVKPVDYKPGETYPTILWIHGGPVSQFDHSFRFEPQLFAANGYAVLMVNPRGSSGYGQAFSEVLFADWGNKDFEDVMAAVDYAVDQGIADPERLGVGGWSYGGILTNYVITKTGRFKAAISGASETLYRSNYGHDHYQLTWEKELGLPWETPEKWERISPFNDVANVTTPTLWMGGSDDWNVPILNSEQMYQAMKRLGLETQLVVYPGEHHGIRTPTFQRDRFERYLGWFEKYIHAGEGVVSN